LLVVPSTDGAVRIWYDIKTYKFGDSIDVEEL